MDAAVKIVLINFTVTIKKAPMRSLFKFLIKVKSPYEGYGTRKPSPEPVATVQPSNWKATSGLPLRDAPTCVRS